MTFHCKDVELDLVGSPLPAGWSVENKQVGVGYSVGMVPSAWGIGIISVVPLGEVSLRFESEDRETRPVLVPIAQLPVNYESAATPCLSPRKLTLEFDASGQLNLRRSSLTILH